MDFASLIFGTSLMAVALALESHRRLLDGPSALHDLTVLDAEYRRGRVRGRGWINCLVGLIGALALLAGFFGAGYVWVAIWAAIPLILLMIILMACLDLVRTQRYLQEKIPELERQMLGRVEASSTEQAGVGERSKRS